MYFLSICEMGCSCAELGLDPSTPPSGGEFRPSRDTRCLRKRAFAIREQWSAKAGGRGGAESLALSVSFA
jgi:hypothetical protein